MLSTLQKNPDSTESIDSLYALYALYALYDNYLRKIQSKENSRELLDKLMDVCNRLLSATQGNAKATEDAIQRLVTTLKMRGDFLNVISTREAITDYQRAHSFAPDDYDLLHKLARLQELSATTEVHALANYEKLFIHASIKQDQKLIEEIVSDVARVLDGLSEEEKIRHLKKPAIQACQKREQERIKSLDAKITELANNPTMKSLLALTQLPVFENETTQNRILKAIDEWKGDIVNWLENNLQEIRLACVTICKHAADKHPYAEHAVKMIKKRLSTLTPKTNYNPDLAFAIEIRIAAEAALKKTKSNENHRRWQTAAASQLNTCDKFMDNTSHQYLDDSHSIFTQNLSKNPAITTALRHQATKLIPKINFTRKILLEPNTDPYKKLWKIVQDPCAKEYPDFVRLMVASCTKHYVSKYQKEPASIAKQVDDLMQSYHEENLPHAKEILSALETEIDSYATLNNNPCIQLNRIPLRLLELKQKCQDNKESVTTRDSFDEEFKKFLNSRSALLIKDPLGLAAQAFILTEEKNATSSEIKNLAKQTLDKNTRVVETAIQAFEAKIKELANQGSYKSLLALTQVSSLEKDEMFIRKGIDGWKGDVSHLTKTKTLDEEKALKTIFEKAAQKNLHAKLALNMIRKRISALPTAIRYQDLNDPAFVVTDWWCTASLIEYKTSNSTENLHQLRTATIERFDVYNNYLEKVPFDGLNNQCLTVLGNASKDELLTEEIRERATQLLNKISLRYAAQQPFLRENWISYKTVLQLIQEPLAKQHPDTALSLATECAKSYSKVYQQEPNLIAKQVDDIVQYYNENKIALASDILIILEKEIDAIPNLKDNTEIQVNTIPVSLIELKQKCQDNKATPNDRNAFNNELKKFLLSRPALLAKKALGLGAKTFIEAEAKCATSPDIKSLAKQVIDANDFHIAKRSNSTTLELAKKDSLFAMDHVTKQHTENRTLGILKPHVRRGLCLYARFLVLVATTDFLLEEMKPLIAEAKNYLHSHAINRQSTYQSFAICLDTIINQRLPQLLLTGNTHPDAFILKEIKESDWDNKKQFAVKYRDGIAQAFSIKDAAAWEKTLPDCKVTQIPVETSKNVVVVVQQPALPSAPPPPYAPDANIHTLFYPQMVVIKPTPLNHLPNPIP